MITDEEKKIREENKEISQLINYLFRKYKK